MFRIFQIGQRGLRKHRPLAVMAQTVVLAGHRNGERRSCGPLPAQRHIYVGRVLMAPDLGVFGIELTRHQLIGLEIVVAHPAIGGAVAQGPRLRPQLMLLVGIQRVAADTLTARQRVGRGGAPVGPVHLHQLVVFGGVTHKIAAHLQSEGCLIPKRHIVHGRLHLFAEVRLLEITVGQTEIVTVGDETSRIGHTDAALRPQLIVQRAAHLMGPIAGAQALVLPDVVHTLRQGMKRGKLGIFQIFHAVGTVHDIHRCAGQRKPEFGMGATAVKILILIIRAHFALKRLPRRTFGHHIEHGTTHVQLGQCAVHHLHALHLIHGQTPQQRLQLLGTHGGRPAVEHEGQAACPSQQELTGTVLPPPPAPWPRLHKQLYILKLILQVFESSYIIFTIAIRAKLNNIIRN